MSTSIRDRMTGRLLGLFVALVALVQAGCLAVAAGVAGGAIAAQAYADGQLSMTVNASTDDTVAAVQTALADLGMPVEQQQREGLGSATITSRTADGEKVKICLKTTLSRIPAEGPLTTVSVRVATFGDRPVSGRLLEQINAHLVSPGTITASTPASVSTSETPAHEAPMPRRLEPIPAPSLPPEPVPAPIAR